VRFLVLAEKDMELVEDAVGLLTAPHMIAGGRLIEAGMFTIYARPYAPDRKRRVLGDEWLPSDPRERKRHDRLIELRNTLYAHTDPDSPRGVEDVDAMLGLGEHGYAESRPELNQAALPRIAALAQAQRRRFREARALRQQELRDDPPRTSIAPLLVRLRRMRERIDTPKGPASLESGGTDWWLVYPTEEAHQPIGNVFEHGRETGDLKYSWSSGPSDAPKGDSVEATKTAAVAMVLRSTSG
jgi:hypothetical protein